jgi:hypothetical protein
MTYKELQSKLKGIYRDIEYEYVIHNNKIGYGNNTGSREMYNVIFDYMQSLINPIPITDKMYGSLLSNLEKFVAGKSVRTMNDITDEYNKLIKQNLPYDELQSKFNQILDVKMNVENSVWLDTEAGVVNDAVTNIKQWDNFMKFPKKMLIYKTHEDDLVRPAHAALDGLTLPADSTTWQSINPPFYDYNCRCYLETAYDVDEPTTDILDDYDSKVANGEFEKAGNPGISTSPRAEGKIFSDEHFNIQLYEAANKEKQGDILK